MSITRINDDITKVIHNLDELEHVDSAELDAVRYRLEDVQEMLDKLAEEFGDDGIDDGDGDGDDD